jgi:hypothetical protein
MSGNFVDDRHTLYVGWVLGAALRNGLTAYPVLDDAGNYTDRITIPFGADSVTLTVVVPYPPEDWTLDGPRPPRQSPNG